MAKKYNEVKAKKLKGLLTTQESKEVDDVELYVDDQIELQWENGNVYIDYCIMRFECDPITRNPLSHPEPKRQIMEDLLFTRFKDADWLIQLSPKEIWKWCLYKKHFD